MPPPHRVFFLLSPLLHPALIPQEFDQVRQSKPHLRAIQRDGMVRSERKQSVEPPRSGLANPVTADTDELGSGFRDERHDPRGVLAKRVEDVLELEFIVFSWRMRDSKM